MFSTDSFREWMWQGKNLVKHQMLLNFAVSSSTFDLELLVRNRGNPKPDGVFWIWSYATRQPTAFQNKKKDQSRGLVKRVLGADTTYY